MKRVLWVGGLMLVVAALGVGLGAACSKRQRDGGPGGGKKFPPGSGRPAAQECPRTREPGTAQPGIQGDCQTDADCSAGQNGRCITGGSRVQQNMCTYDSCFTDADCKASSGGPCECNSWGGNSCLAGDCQVDADCASGSCGRANAIGCGGGPASYWCRTGKDSCVDDDDCKKNQRCGRDQAQKRFRCFEEMPCPVG
ncbi:MAG: hypothetical protein IT370_28865 [Deltaproteobacteria bacterium]|nr:hypothetical protein [Deltaproteobacteria bacterium]